MADYNLDSDEMFIFECEDVTLDEKKMVNRKGSVVLTNKNLIWVTKNLFGKVKNIEKYPIKEIKIYDEKAQVTVKEKMGEEPKLLVFFKGFELTFIMESKTKARELANNINKCVTGSEADLLPKRSIPGTAFMAETLKGTVGTFVNAIGKKQKVAEKMSKSCPACGAKVSGIIGSIVKCEYCNTEIKLD